MTLTWCERSERETVDWNKQNLGNYWRALFSTYVSVARGMQHRLKRPEQGREVKGFKCAIGNCPMINERDICYLCPKHDSRVSL